MGGEGRKEAGGGRIGGGRTGGGGGAWGEIILERFDRADSSASRLSFSSPSSLNLFLRLSKEPFSNICIALGWSVQ